MKKYVLILIVFTTIAVMADPIPKDWTTKDGKTYRNVTVLRVDADAVTIMDSDGVSLIDLDTLPEILQKQFHYHPNAAQIARDKRLADEQAQDHAWLASQTSQTSQTAITPTPALVTVSVTRPTPAHTDTIQQLKSQIASLLQQADEADAQQQAVHQQYNATHTTKTSISIDAGDSFRQQAANLQARLATLTQ